MSNIECTVRVSYLLQHALVQHVSTFVLPYGASFSRTRSTFADLFNQTEAVDRITVKRFRFDFDVTK